MPKQPPFVNGIMTLTDTEITDIQTALQAIQTAFVETDEQPVCDTFYLVSTYNKENTDSPINGDTAEYVLGLLNPPQEG
jgi:hypothetical protein